MQYDIDSVSREFRINMENLCSLYRIYIKEVQNYFTQIDKLPINNDWNKIQTLIHKIKGMSENLKVLDVYNEAKIIDDLIWENKFEDILEKIKALKITFFDAQKNIIKAFEDKGMVIYR